MIGAYIARGKMKRSCHKCEKAPTLKQTWCCEPQGRPVSVLYRGTAMEITTERCPMAHVRNEPSIARVLNLYGMWESGTMPHPGGSMNQSKVLMDAFGIINQCYAEMKGAGDGNV